MIWLTRGHKPLLNRRTGQTAEGNFTSRVTGPDGLANSALYFDGTKNLVLPLKAALTDKMTFQIGLKLVIPATYIKSGVTNPTAASLCIVSARQIGAIQFNLQIRRTYSVTKNGVPLEGVGGIVNFNETFLYNFNTVGENVVFVELSVAAILEGFDYIPQLSLEDQEILPEMDYNNSTGIHTHEIPVAGDVTATWTSDEPAVYVRHSVTEILGWQFSIVKAA